MIRITGGELKGLRIKVPRGARPTTERVRQAIFSIIGDEIRGAVVLDLFCGSGILGIEALSRGAAFAFFIDSAREAVEYVQESLLKLGLVDRARVKKSFFPHCLKSLQNKMIFDVIFADPPYMHSGVPDLLKLAGGSTVLRDGGCLVIEHARKVKVPDNYGRLNAVIKKHYGGTSVTIYRKER